MTDPSEPSSELTRRSMLGGGIALAATAVGLAAATGARPAYADAATSGQVSALEPVVEGLVYLPLDAFAFHTASLTTSPYRLYQETTGMQPQPAANWLYATLPIPIGSVVKKINVFYMQTVIITIGRRSFTSSPADLIDLFPLANLNEAGPSPKSSTVTVNAELTPGASYSMKVFCSAGNSILGMTVGYVPPAQGFIPYAGTTPRAFDSRSGTRFAPGEERVVDLSSRLIPTARAAVVNITATGTAGAGYLAAFRDGIVWPGNSTVNYGADQSVANTAIVSVNAGKIKIRCGDAATHVIVDVVGSLL